MEKRFTSAGKIDDDDGNLGKEMLYSDYCINRQEWCGDAQTMLFNPFTLTIPSLILDVYIVAKRGFSQESITE